MSRKLQIVCAALACLTLAVGAYAVWAEYSSFPPHLRGFGEVTRAGEVAGWAVDASDPTTPVEVQLYVDDHFVAHAVATLPRPDVVAAGRTSDPNCGYRLALPTLAAGAHEARVYALHTSSTSSAPTLKQLGDTLHFEVGGNGRPAAPAR